MNKLSRFSLILLLAAWHHTPALAYAYVNSDDRGKELLAAPLNDFDFDVQYLVANPSLRLKAVEDPDKPFEPRLVMSRDLRREYELGRLSADDAVKVTRMRNSANASEAYAEGVGLQEGLRLYTAGAVAFDKYDFTAAQSFFGRASNLPGADPAYRVWSEYMLGRTEARLGHAELAERALMATRQLVIDGAPDPVGLGVASYGAQARLLLTEAGGLLGEQDFTLGKPGRSTLLQRAMDLYVQQAATGSTSAANSLHILCKEIQHEPADTVVLDGSELARQVFLLYMLEYGGRWNGPANAVDRLKSLLPRFSTTMPDFASQLADAAYRVGDLTLAETYARQSDSAMALWTRAKLALARDQRDQAWDLLQQAMHMVKVESEQPSLGPDAIRALNRDAGQLAAARGDFEAALTSFRTAQDWDDAAYIAEQVLTAQELRNYVDGSVNEPATAEAQSQWRYSDPPADPQIDLHLRALLGRRLIRTGETYDVAKYFNHHAEAKCTIFDTNVSCNARLLTQFPTDQFDLVTAYIGYQDTVAHARGVKAADALYHMAILERYMPDTLFNREMPSSHIDVPTASRNLTVDTFMGLDEIERVNTSAGESKIDETPRRLVGAHLMQAADDLPPSSQAYAAVLCFGMDWTSAVSEQSANAFYRRYLAAGSPGAWTAHFGNNCPQPDFAEAASSDPRHRAVYWLRHHRSFIFVCSSAGALLLLGLLAVRLARRPA